MHSDFVDPAWNKNIRAVEDYFLKDFDLSFLDNPVINPGNHYVFSVKGIS